MSKNTNLSFLTDFLTADIVNSRVGMNNVSPQATFDVTGTGKFSGVLTLGSTVSNGTYTYTLPSATGTLALTSDIPSVSGYVPYTGATQAVNLGYNSLSASFLRVDGEGPTLGSYLGFKHSTNVTTGADGYTSIYTFGTNRIAFKSISGATTRDFSFSMASITPGVPGGRIYTLPDADGTIALTSSLSGYLPLSGGILTGTTRMDGSGGTVPSITMIFNSGVNRLLAPLLRLYGATNESSNYIELFGSSATSNRTINFPDASGTVALTSNIPANPVGGTGTSGTIPVFTGSTTIGNSIIQSNATQVNVVGNGSQLLFDSLGQSKSGGIQYTNDFELLINNSRGTGSAIFLGNTNIDFHTNVSGNPRLRITDGGNILVGTTTDNGAKFQVNGGVTITNSVGGTTASNYLQIEGSTANNTNYPGILFKGGTLVTTYPSIALSNGGIALILTQGSSATYPNTSQISLNNGAITLSTGSTLSPRLTVNEVGNVLIGTTTNPYNVASLVVNHNSTFSRTYFQRGVELIEIVPSDGTAANFISSSYTASGSAYKPLAFSGRQNPADLYLATSGNVGIGVTSPSYTLHVKAASGSTTGLRLESSGGTTNFDILSSEGDGNAYLYQRSNYGILIGTNNALRMTITAGGNVGIGTQTPVTYGTRNLDVNGGAGTAYIVARGSNNAGIIEMAFDGAGYMGTKSAHDLVIRTNDIQRINIFATSGNVLIGTGSDNGNKFQVNGNATINGSGNTLLVNSSNNSLALGVGFQGITSGYIGGISSALYGYSTNGGYVLLNSSSAWVPASDIKRKRNFEPYTKGISAILGLQPKLYNMDFQKDGDEKQVGLVAQEVREFIPLAYEENADFIGINYNAIIVTMVKAIQEQQQQIQELKNKLS